MICSSRVVCKHGRACARLCEHAFTRVCQFVYVSVCILCIATFNKPLKRGKVGTFSRDRHKRGIAAVPNYVVVLLFCYLEIFPYQRATRTHNHFRIGDQLHTLFGYFLWNALSEKHHRRFENATAVCTRGNWYGERRK